MNVLPAGLVKFEGVVSILEKIFAELPLQQIKLFLTVAKHEGATMPELQKILDTPQGTLSRNVKALSVYLKPADSTVPGSLRTKGGYELLESRPDSENRKALAVYLTPKGKKILKQINDTIMAEK